MYAKLFICGNTGVREGEQNLAAAVAVHTLENLLAANTAHGEKLVGLILSFPESQRNGGGPESPEPAVPTARHVGVLRVLMQLDTAWSTPCPAPAFTLHNVSVSQTHVAVSWTGFEWKCSTSKYTFGATLKVISAIALSPLCDPALGKAAALVLWPDRENHTV